MSWMFVPTPSGSWSVSERPVFYQRLRGHRARQVGAHQDVCLVGDQLFVRRVKPDIRVEGLETIDWY